MRPLVLTVLFAVPITLPADTRTVTKMTIGNRETITTEYVSGDNRRIESEELSGDAPPRQSVTIALGRKVSYQIDLKARQYVEYEIPQPKPVTGPPVPTYQSGKRLDIYFETTDTGETKQFFGQTAKHLIFHRRIVAEPGGCSDGVQTDLEVDGWYIPDPAKPSSKGFAMLMGSRPRDGKLCQDKISFHGHPPAGLAVISNNGSFKTEILEFSNGPIDKSLFEVPSGFEKVRTLPGDPPPPSWSQTMEWQFTQLWQEIQSWFR